MKNADLLDRLLDGNPVLDADVPDDLDGLAMLADMLSATAPPLVPMRTETRSELRNELIRQANAQVASPPSFFARLRDRAGALRERLIYSGRIVAASGTAMAVLSTGGVAAAASNSLPGDLFYDLKLAYEDTLLALSDGPLDRGEGLMAQADNRLDEADRALRNADQATAGAALRLTDEHARDGAGEFFAAYLDGGDTAILRQLGDWVISANARLDGFPTLVGQPAMAEADLRVSLNRIGQRIEVLVTGACSSCDLGVHDDPDADPDVSRGLSADGTPPLPAGTGSDVVDLTVIPSADQPFQACPCSRRAPAGAAVPPPADRTEGTTPTEQDEVSGPPPSTGSSGGGGSGGGNGGGGSGGGGGTLPVPVPDTAPATDQLPEPVRDPVRDAVEEVIQSLPDAGDGQTPASQPAPSDDVGVGQ